MTKTILLPVTFSWSVNSGLWIAAILWSAIRLFIEVQKTIWSLCWILAMYLKSSDMYRYMVEVTGVPGVPGSELLLPEASCKYHFTSETVAAGLAPSTWHMKIIWAPSKTSSDLEAVMLTELTGAETLTHVKGAVSVFLSFNMFY